jgi:hypothetical protein
MRSSRPKVSLDSAARAAAALVIAACATAAVACSKSSAVDDDSRPQGMPDAAAPNPEDGAVPMTADAAFSGRCGRHVCRMSGLETPGCCTAPGTGEPGHELENTGRAPGLCGTDVGLLIPPLAGTCLQLDQPGDVDDECPAQEPIGGGLRMPGCCTDEGHCGSVETLVGFGCFYATGRKGRTCIPGPDTLRPRDPDADGGT